MLKNASILTGSTVSAAGGTSSTLTLAPHIVTRGIRIWDLSVTDPRVRPYIECSVRPAQMKADGSWLRQVSEYKIVMPKLLASGVVNFPLFHGRMELHPEMSDAEIVKLMTWNAQFCFDADFTSFMKYGSVE